MAKRKQSEPIGTAGQAVLWAIVGAVACAVLHWPLLLGLVVGGAWPLLQQLRREPWKDCPRCGGKTTVRSGRTYGVKRECRRCHGGRYPRVPTRVGMAFGWRPRGAE